MVSAFAALNDLYEFKLSDKLDICAIFSYSEGVRSRSSGLFALTCARHKIADSTLILMILP